MEVERGELSERFRVCGCDCVMEIKKGRTAPLALPLVTEGSWGLMRKDRQSHSEERRDKIRGKGTACGAKGSIITECLELEGTRQNQRISF